VFLLQVVLLEILCSSAVCVGHSPAITTEDPQTNQAKRANKLSLDQRDTFWAEVSRSVKEGDFEGYAATCHPLGVLVSGIAKTSQPLTSALKRWKPEFEATKSGTPKASVEFRFSTRLGDATTAHETGIFRYSTVDADGKRTDEYIHFEVLLVREQDATGEASWQTMMEFQKSIATSKEWEALLPK